jgi:hypothetical protein
MPEKKNREWVRRARRGTEKPDERARSLEVTEAPATIGQSTTP